MTTRPPIPLIEAALYIGRHPSYLRRLVQRRAIKHYKVGGRVLFDRADLDALLDAAAVEPCRE